ncbi:MULTISPECIES: hypothetical protein [Sphingomonas]|jgi:hypothetical protein|uniref:Uncharacterized protein n=1 Tax=Sphingomonas paucimobilis TaxID=13689 RepID=A0A411LML8_SPHPI|nr:MULTISPECIES: hypothetical protein [Sphingomonas]MBQ1480785.1 hypothetical protein [Sphingomonas sp.]NNG56823.1 hypothetical protein [Sphingomonas paucimobilis]QBE93574.1 hypothetical protein DRN02_017380 [Sphingomonas paucimobilis]QPS15495.1 hypothetical protein I6G65_14175 [Sphingomonas paucimobilis]QPT10249.1 hypothetical protein I6G38_08620 [Sphingomonas paucimobilis]
MRNRNRWHGHIPIRPVRAQSREKGADRIFDSAAAHLVEDPARFLARPDQIGSVQLDRLSAWRWLPDPGHCFDLANGTRSIQRRQPDGQPVRLCRHLESFDHHIGPNRIKAHVPGRRRRHRWVFLARSAGGSSIG